MSKRETRTGGREATDAVVPGKYALSIGMPPLVAPPGFTWRKLTDVARLESGHTPSRSRTEYWNGDIPWIGIRDATGNHGLTIMETKQLISQGGLNNSSARLLPAGTVCLSRTASVGYVVIMGVPMATSQDFVNWVCGPELSPQYFRYVLMVEQDSIRRFAYGTTHQTLYYPDAKALHSCLPSRRNQDAIACVLGALDDKIAANSRLIGITRRVAHTHFRATLPTGAPETHLVADATSILARGITPKYTVTDDGVKVLNQKCIRNQEIDLTDSRLTEPTRARTEKMLKVNDVLVNSTGQGTLGRVARCTTSLNATVDSHITIVRFEPQVIDPAVAGYAMLAIQPEIEAMGEGSTGQTELARAELGKLMLTVPGPASQRELSHRLTTLDELENAHRQENNNLALLRDTLLPQLMSGKLRVRDAEKQVEEVA